MDPCNKIALLRTSSQAAFARMASQLCDSGSLYLDVSLALKKASVSSKSLGLPNDSSENLMKYPKEKFPSKRL